MGTPPTLLTTINRLTRITRPPRTTKQPHRPHRVSCDPASGHVPLRPGGHRNRTADAAATEAATTPI